MKYVFSRHSTKMLIGSILAGLIYGVIGEFLYAALSVRVPSVVLSFIYFTGLYVWIGMAIYLIGKVLYSRYRFEVLMKAWILSFILMLICSVSFEFIYDIIQKRDKLPNYESYLFVIDDSGSMDANDPEGLRYKAIETLLADKPSDFEFGVISFSSDTKIIREMGPVSDGIQLGEPSNSGGTAMKGALKFIEQKIKDKELKADRATRIILLTDGQPTDVFFKSGIMKVLKFYSKKGITISTVGLLYADDSFMQMIADKTGGVYVRCDDVSKLETALQHAAVHTDEYRNLLGYRSGYFLNVLLGILRILFVGALGLIIAVEKTAICDMFLDSTKVLITSTVCGILAGFCIELGMNAFGVNPLAMRIFTCVLLSITFLDEDAQIFKKTGNEYKMTEDIWG